jgi:hypothetical protein
LDKISNIAFLSIDKIHNLISYNDLQWKVSYHAIQNIILAIYTFLNEKAYPIEIIKLSVEVADKDLVIKLNVLAELNPDDFEWLNWILQSVARGAIVSHSSREHEIQFKLDVEIRNPAEMSTISNQGGSNLLDVKVLSPIHSKEDEQTSKILSQDALDETMSILDSAPEIEEEFNLESPGKAQKAIGSDEEVRFKYKRPAVLDIPTRIRKPKGNIDVT